MLRIGVIGLGKMGIRHLANASSFSNVEIVGAADLSKESLRQAKLLGAKNLYSDYKELLKTDLDAVIISLPNFMHRESVELALEEGINVFVEKPLARTTEECKKILRAVEKSGRHLMIGHSMRFSTEVEEMKKIVDSGSIGQLEVLTLENIASGPFSHGAVPKPVPEWWFDAEKVGGGALIDLGYHLIDLYRFFAGDCYLLSSNLGHKYNLPLEDWAIVTVKSNDSPARGIVHVGWYQQVVFPKNNIRAIIHGDYTYISSEQFVPSNIYAYAVKEGMQNVFRKVSGRKIKPLFYSPFSDGFVKELSHFFDCLEKDMQPSVSAIDGLKTVEVIENAYKQAKQTGENV
jgi:myo-inositol 2-dehydrogenase/D-chiro-inositol 1-dehydrogenase